MPLTTAARECGRAARPLQVAPIHPHRHIAGCALTHKIRPLDMADKVVRVLARGGR